MPAVAKILGVKTPALYHHFDSREALISEIGQQVFADMPIPSPDPENWRQWLHDINMQLYQFIMANPMLIEAADSPQGFLALTLNLCEAILETLQEAGFEQQQSYWTMLTLTQIAYSAARNEVEGRSTDTSRSEFLFEQIKQITEQNPRSAEFMRSLPQNNNREWLDQLLRWSIECIPEPNPKRAL